MQSLISILVLAGAATAHAAAANDPATPVERFIDAFNQGDAKTAGSVYAAGPVAIVDEFAPHV